MALPHATLYPNFSGANGEYPWVFAGYDNVTLTLWGDSPPWTALFNEVALEGDSGSLGYVNGSSHLPIPLTGISQSNIHVINACWNTQSC